MKTLKETLHQLKSSYLVDVARATGEGGNAKSFRQLVQQDFEQNPIKYHAHLSEALDKSASSVWDHDRVEDSDQTDLFTVDGRSIGVAV